jgi:hypothetical protein
MSQEGRKLTRAKQAVGTFINEGVSPDTAVGLTTFNVDTTVRRSPKPLSSEQEKHALVSELPDGQLGATDLSQGLAAAAYVGITSHCVKAGVVRENVCEACCIDLLGWILIIQLH